MPNMFDVESVHKVLSKLRPDKAMGPDGMLTGTQVPGTRIYYPNPGS